MGRIIEIRDGAVYERLLAQIDKLEKLVAQEVLDRHPDAARGCHGRCQVMIFGARVEVVFETGMAVSVIKPDVAEPPPAIAEPTPSYEGPRDLAWHVSPLISLALRHVDKMQRHRYARNLDG